MGYYEKQAKKETATIAIKASSGLKKSMQNNFEQRTGLQQIAGNRQRNKCYNPFIFTEIRIPIRSGLFRSRQLRVAYNQHAESACSKSAIKSSLSSKPTDNRKIPSPAKSFHDCNCSGVENLKDVSSKSLLFR